MRLRTQKVQLNVCSKVESCRLPFHRLGRKSSLGRFKKKWFVARERLQCWYAGRVQGVGFRYQTKRLAESYEVVGLVRNLLDGRVEMVAEGEREELEAFTQAIRDSGLGPLIRDEKTEWSAAKSEFRGFEIAR